MIEYVVENTTEESVTVDGLGVLLPKSTEVVSPDRAEQFAVLRGLKLTQVYMPKGVDLHVLVTDGGE